MHARELVEQVEAGHVPAVALLVGAERLFIERAVNALREATLADAERSLNQEAFDGRNASGAAIADAVRTLPMFAARRFVLVRGVDAMKADELERLGAVLEEPSETTCLVLTAEKLDGRSRFVRRAKQLGFLADAAPLRPNELRGFVRAEAKRRGLTLRADAGAALVDALGTDLPAIDDALERLSLYVGDARTVELEAVERCVTRVATDSIWALVDGMGARDRVKTLSAARSLLSAGEPPLRLLAMVTRQLRMLCRARDALSAGAPPEQAAREAGAPPFKARELAHAARRLDASRIQRAFGLLADADIALKSSRQPPDTILEAALLALTR